MSLKFDELKMNKDLIATHFVFADIQRLYALAFWNIAKYITEDYQDPKAAAPFALKAITLSTED